MIDPVDIIIGTFNRKAMTEKCLTYLNNRTKYPYRLFVVDNNSTDGTDEILRRFEKKGTIFHWVKMSKNVGIHMLWNTGLGLVSSEYYCTADNDLYVPDLEPDWLDQMVRLIRNNPEYGAIAAQPHTFLGARAPEVHPSGVSEVGHCGAVFRIMKTELVKKAGGWKYVFDSKRNDEEKTICSRLKTLGYKVGYANHIKCWHDFGTDDNWGYEKITPHEHGHRIPGLEIWPTPSMLNKPELYDEKTWELKGGEK